VYDLRHASATLLLLQGVNVKVVSQRLRHESIEITLKHYVQCLPAMQEAAATAVDRLFGDCPTVVPQEAGTVEVDQSQLALAQQLRAHSSTAERGTHNPNGPLSPSVQYCPNLFASTMVASISHSARVRQLPPLSGPLATNWLQNKQVGDMVGAVPVEIPATVGLEGGVRFATR
jgi:hypothetical protein